MNALEFNWYNIKSTKQVKLKYLENLEDDSIKELRREYPEGSFLGYDSKVYFWNCPNIKGFKTEKIDYSVSPYLFLRIISSCLLNQFYNSKYFFIDRNKSIEFIFDFRTEVLPKKYPYLKMYFAYDFHFSPLYANGKYNLGFSITSSISEKITWTKDDFIKEKVPFNDLEFNDDGIVKTNSKSKFRISEHFKESEELKKDLDALGNEKLEYERCKLFIQEFFINKINSFSFPYGIDVFNFIPLKLSFGSPPRSSFKLTQFDKPLNYFFKGITPPIKAVNYLMRDKIRYNKPFSFALFDGRELKISVIYPRHKYSSIAKFCAYIRDELNEIYKIQKKQLKFNNVAIDDFNLTSYQSAMQEIGDPNLAIILIDESHENLSPSLSPYFFCKSEFIKRGINSQEIQIQQVENFIENKKLKKSDYTDHTISLNIYAKLGGTAWTIQPRGEERNELVFGVGATTDDKGQPILGMTSIFRGDGKYLLGEVTSIVNIDTYSQKLEKLISTSISQNINSGIINRNNTIYLTFHLFKKAGKNNEIEALQNALKHYAHLDINYMFVYAGEGHNFRFYPFENEVTIENFSNTQRGTFLKINNRLGFIALKKDSSRYLKVEIDKRSNIIDLNYAAKQVYQFSDISHTSFNIQAQPVTIKYPKLMARMAEKLSHIDGFYLNTITLPNDSLWFI